MAGRIQDGYLAEKQPARGSTEALVAVWREHGTSAAAAWSGLKENTTRNRLVRAGCTVRGRGHPTTAEVERAKPRWNCSCPMCAEIRSAEAAASNRRHAQIGSRRIIVEDGEPWREFAACRDEGPSLWYAERQVLERWRPLDLRRADTERAKDICDTCTVSVECLRFALVNHEPDGVWGGLTLEERLDLSASTRRRIIAGDVEVPS